MSDTILNLIDLDQRIEGYREFLSCWICRKDGLTFIVDPGPLSTTELLVDSIKQLGIKKLDFILLTHIHLDHGGGTHEMIRAFPEAQVYCHKMGRKHLVDPEKLWRGSEHVLGNIAKIYGKPDPIDKNVLTDGDRLKSHGIEPIPTPGHAPHHVAFQIGDVLFAGEAIGTRLSLPSGLPYLRPATPPRFVLDEALHSLDTLLTLNPKPHRTAFAHYGLVTNGPEWCKRSKNQLKLWVNTIRDLHEESREDLENRLFHRLMEVDPLYGQGRFDELAPDLQKRERHFLGNTLHGMLGYIEQETQSHP